jgi:DNA-binding CsgD family transcriptional regulator
MHRLSSQQRQFAVESASQNDSLNELFLTLLERVPKPTAGGIRKQEILLETDLDGSRYLLVRLPSAPYSAPSLSPREGEIVRMVSEGLPNKVIADVLNISSWTVSTHLRRIFAKLGVSSRAAMVAQLLEVRGTIGANGDGDSQRFGTASASARRRWSES